jgi:hypothetical protein
MPIHVRGQGGDEDHQEFIVVGGKERESGGRLEAMKAA